MSSPKKRMVPDDGGKSPVTQLNSVVLPAPLEPSTARRSPGRTVMVTSVNAASAPNSRVTPRSSRAAPEPTAEKRCAALSMTVASARAMVGGRSAAAPSLPESDHAIGGPEHDGEEAEADQQAEAVAVELVARILYERGLCNASVLIRGDNQGVIGSYGRGRGRNLHINLAVRRTEVIGTSSNLLYVLEYTESKLNKADPISRGELGPFSKQITDYVQLPEELAPFLHHV